MASRMNDRVTRNNGAPMTNPSVTAGSTNWAADARKADQSRARMESMIQTRHVIGSGSQRAAQRCWSDLQGAVEHEDEDEGEPELRNGNSESGENVGHWVGERASPQR